VFLVLLHIAKNIVRCRNADFYVTLCCGSVCRYDISVTCKDGGQPSLTSRSPLTVHVTDVNDHSPQFTDQNFYSVELPENTEVGTLIARLSATDSDAGENGRVAYQLFDQASQLFAVDSETGAVRTRAALDRETASHHRIIVAAVDAGSPPRSSTAVIDLVVGDVDDEPPRFTLPVYSLRVSENRPPGTEVGAVAARDGDGEPFNHFQFRMIVNNDSEAFEIDPISGLITTRSSLNREQRALYRLTIAAEPTRTTSASGMSSTTIVNIKVNNDSRKLYAIVLITIELPVIGNFTQR